MGCGSSKTEEASTQPGTTKSETKSEPHEPSAGTVKAEPAAAKGTKTEEKSGSNYFVAECVNKHNELRALHGAPPMTEAQDLIEYSQKYADRLAKSDKMEHSKCTLPSGDRVGENLYCCWSSDPSAGVSAGDAVQSWYDEIKDYDFNNGTFSMGTGHFTQVVWKGSTELGVACAKASGGTWYVVANYRPAGNMMGDFSDNVLPVQ